MEVFEDYSNDLANETNSKISTIPVLNTTGWNHLFAVERQHLNLLDAANFVLKCLRHHFNTRTKTKKEYWNCPLMHINNYIFIEPFCIFYTLQKLLYVQISSIQNVFWFKFCDSNFSFYKKSLFNVNISILFTNHKIWINNNSYGNTRSVCFWD